MIRKKYVLVQQKNTCPKRLWILFCILFIFFFSFICYGGYEAFNEIHQHVSCDNMRAIVKKFFAERQGLKLSKLGEILFSQTDIPPKKSNTFKILIWKEGSFLQRRHIQFFSNTRHDPFTDCSVKNCILSYEDDDVSNADAVVFLLLHLTRDTLPNQTHGRPVGQRWIFLTDENPFNTFINKSNNWLDYMGVFNWSMSYRMESDVPVPYGRVISNKLNKNNQSHVRDTLIESLIPNNEIKRRDVLVAVILSNCSETNPIVEYIKAMQAFINVDIYGKCGTQTSLCPTHFAKDCPILKDYMFYFSFETAHCKEYLTQKLFSNSYAKGAVPIIAGVSMADCRIILPPNSYLHVSNFSSPEDLSLHILSLNRTWEESLVRIHGWRRNLKVLNEHGYFGTRSYHYCRICEALNYNGDEIKIYNDNLGDFLSPQRNCLE